MIYESKPQFYGVIARASNIGMATGNYTAEMFLEDFPQFYHLEDDVPMSWVPETVLAQFISQANVSIQPDKWLDQWRYACGLFVAHHATMYLKTMKTPDGFTMTPMEAVASGEVIGTVKSATLGDASISYDASSSTGATAAWGDLNATQYGQMLATKARLVGMGGSYVL